MINNKIIKLSFGLLGVSLVLWLVLLNWKNPYSTIEEIKKIDLTESEVSYRENYDQLVLYDKEQGNEFVIGKVKYAKVVNESFPFSSRQLDAKQTRLIVEVLNDTSSYCWGEFGTPTYDQIIYYFDSTDQVIGYTKIDMMGEVENYPYRSLMKWGLMTDKGFSRLIKLMNRK